MADVIQPRLTSVDNTYTGVLCTLASGITNGNVTADFRIIVTPSVSMEYYDIRVYTRLTANYWFAWTGEGTLKVKVTWTGTDGRTVTQNRQIDTVTPLQVGSNSTPYTTPWNAPVEFYNFSAKGVKTINVDIDLDLLRTACAICYEDDGLTVYHGPGRVTSDASAPVEPGYDHDHYQHFYLSKTINVESIPLVTVPTISNLRNTDSHDTGYDVGVSVSAKEKSISLAWDHTGGSDIDNSYYRIGTSGSWTKTTNLLSHTFNNLTSGTIYDIYIKSSNVAGDGNIVNLKVRTRYEIPKVQLSIDGVTLESITVAWESDRDLASIYYKLDGSQDWNFSPQTGFNQGIFTINGISPGTLTKVNFYAISSYEYDSLTSEILSIEGTTHKIAAIYNDKPEYIFGEQIKFNITNNSQSPVQLEFLTYIVNTDNSFSARAKFIKNVERGTVEYTFIPTQEELDSMYKCYQNQNHVRMDIKIITIGSGTNTWSNIYTKQLVLTGIAKTIHTGDDKSKDRRGQVWIGDDATKARRAIIWIGDDNNKPRRGI